MNKIEDLIKDARSWIGTSYKHQGRVKKNLSNLGGCDCLGLIMGLKLKTKDNFWLKEFDLQDYPKKLSSNIMLETLDLYLNRVTNNELQIGNIILIKLGAWPQHLAIVSKLEPNICIIHSYLQARSVVEQHLSVEWLSSIVAVYGAVK